MATAASLTAAERDLLSDEAEARLDRLLSFDDDVDDGWGGWPYDHYPGEACPVDATPTVALSDDEFDAAFAAMEAHHEPRRGR